MNPHALSRLVARLFLCLLFHAGLRAADDDSPVRFEADVKVPMRDGTVLSANVFRPSDAGPWPVILARTPYGKGDAKWGPGRSYAAKGYAVVVQDCRGRGQSGGAWDPFANDAADGFDTQEWIGHQPWCNGSIGTMGGSYGGWTQWATAPNSSRYLKAMVPVVPFANTYDDVVASGGAMMLGLMMGWGQAVGGIALDGGQARAAYAHLPLLTYADQFRKDVPYLREWMRHPVYDAYWKARGIDRRYADVSVPVLNIGGWYDIFSKAAVELTSGVRSAARDPQVRRHQHLIMGPWAHGVGGRKTGELDFGPDAVLKVGAKEAEWLDHWLKGRDNGVERWPAYQIFVMGENRWRAEDEWPLRRTRYTRYHLGSAGRANSLRGDGVLTSAVPEADAGVPDHFTSDGNRPVPSKGGNNLVGATAGPEDQTAVEQRDDVLVYTTPPLEADTEVTGPVKLVLWASSSAKDTDFTGKLVDVHPDGKAYNLCEGILRARYRRGLDRPALLEPGRAERMEIDLWVTSNVFKRGHRIRLEVSGGNFPRFDRNPNSGLPFGTDTVLLPAEQTVCHDRRHPSHLLLPVIPR